MQSWMRELGLVMNIAELGADQSMIEGITQATLVLKADTRSLGMTKLRKY